MLRSYQVLQLPICICVSARDTDCTRKKKNVSCPCAHFMRSRCVVLIVVDGWTRESSHSIKSTNGNCVECGARRRARTDPTIKYQFANWFRAGRNIHYISFRLIDSIFDFDEIVHRHLRHRFQRKVSFFRQFHRHWSISGPFKSH